MNVIKNYHFLPINFVFLHTRQCWNSNYQFVTKNVTKKMELYGNINCEKEEEKKREQNTYNNFLFCGSISKAFWNNATVKLHPVKSSIPMQHVYKRQCFDAWMFKSNHDYRPSYGSCILRESHANRISQISEKPRCTFKCVGVITIRSRDI